MSQTKNFFGVPNWEEAKKMCKEQEDKGWEVSIHRVYRGYWLECHKAAVEATVIDIPPENWEALPCN